VNLPAHMVHEQVEIDRVEKLGQVNLHGGAKALPDVFPYMTGRPKFDTYEVTTGAISIS